MAGEASHLDGLLDYLESVGADGTAHTHGSLREHLKGTYDLLAGWGAPERVCLAGLFHSVYGTERFQTTTISLDDRSEVRARIGDDAERLVYLYAVLRRASLYANLDRGWPYSVETLDGGTEGVHQDEFVDLMTLDLANRLEQTHGPLGDGDRATYRKAIPPVPAAAVAGRVVARAAPPRRSAVARPQGARRTTAEAPARRLRTRFRMTLRRRGALGECAARTQGAPISNRYRRDRGHRSVPHSAARRHKASF